MVDKLEVPLTATEETVAVDGDVAELDGDEPHDQETARTTTMGTKRCRVTSLSWL